MQTPQMPAKIYTLFPECSASDMIPLAFRPLCILTLHGWLRKECSGSFRAFRFEYFGEKSNLCWPDFIPSNRVLILTRYPLKISSSQL